MKRWKSRSPFRERVVADEHRIAGALLQFGDSVKELSFKEQCELVRLIVRGIRVNRLDPEKEPIPGGIEPGGEENTNSVVFG